MNSNQPLRLEKEVVDMLGAIVGLAILLSIGMVMIMPFLLGCLLIKKIFI